MNRGRGSSGAAETGSHPFRSLFDLMVVLVFLFAAAFALSRSGGQERVDAAPLKSELLTLHNVERRRKAEQEKKPVPTPLISLTQLDKNDKCQALVVDGDGKVTKDEMQSLEQHRQQLWKDNAEEIKKQLLSRSIRIEVSQNELTFPSGSAVPADLSRTPTVLAEVYRRYQEGYHRIRVEGHTDNVAIKTAQFPSNWELSAARAIFLAGRIEADLQRRNVSLQATGGTVEAVGYGDKKPRFLNDTEVHRNANRRIEIVFEK